MITLAQVKDSGLAEEMGYSREDTAFIGLLNSAVQRLVESGDWWGLRRKVKCRVIKNRLILPPYIAALERVSVNGVVTKIRGEAFEFLEGGYGVAEDQSNPRTWYCGADIVDQGFSALSTPLTCPVRISASSDADECTGAYVTVLGHDRYGNEIRSQDSDDCWYDGVKLMLAEDESDTSPPTSLSEFMDITAIVKPVTNGNVTISTNDMTGFGLVIARLGPADRTSEYRAYSVPRMTCVSDDPCCAPIVTAVVKMGFRTVANDDDVIPVGNIPAIKDACWAEYYSNKPGGDQVAIARWQRALATLENQLKHHRGSGQTNPLAIPDDGTYGSSGIGNLYGTCGYGYGLSQRGF